MKTIADKLRAVKRALWATSRESLHSDSCETVNATTLSEDAPCDCYLTDVRRSLAAFPDPDAVGVCVEAWRERLDPVALTWPPDEVRAALAKLEEKP